MIKNNFKKNKKKLKKNFKMVNRKNNIKKL